MAKPIDVQQLSRDERLDLIEERWESLSAEERNSVSLSPEQEQELDRRLDALAKDGPVGSSSEDVRRRIRTRSP